jgi:microcystin-dependent protein
MKSSLLEAKIKDSHVSKLLRATLVSTAIVGCTSAMACEGTDSYIGSICTTAANYCPQDYVLANGALLQVNQNAALFSLLSNLYGGDGKTTFALPDLRGLTTVATVPGRYPGNKSGAETVTLSTNNLPTHSHSSIYSKFGGDAQLNAVIPVSSNTGANTQTAPDSTHSYLAGSSTALPGAIWSSTMNKVTTIQGATATISGGNGVVTVAPAGSSQPVSTLPPQIGLTYCIAVRGIYPMRD